MTTVDPLQGIEDSICDLAPSAPLLLARRLRWEITKALARRGHYDLDRLALFQCPGCSATRAPLGEGFCCIECDTEDFSW